MAQQPPGALGSPHCRGFNITLIHTTLSRTPLDEWSAKAETSTWKHIALTRERQLWRRRDSNPQSQQARGRKTHALDGAATGTGFIKNYCIMNYFVWSR